MKYSSKDDKRFHADIVGALRRAFRKDTEIPKHKNDGSPDELRDYLKNRYNNYGGSISEEYSHDLLTFRFNAKELVLTFNEVIATSGGVSDKELILSRSQLTTFVRNNMDEIFPAEDSEEDEPTKKRTYLEILLSSERYEGLTEEHFIYQEDYCPYDLFDLYGAPHIVDDKCSARTDSSGLHRDCEKCRSCWNSVCECDEGADFDSVILDDDLSGEDVLEAHEKYVASHREEYQAALEIHKEARHSPAVPAETEETAVQTQGFDYSVIEDKGTAEQLYICEAVIKSEIQTCATQIGARLKEAQELLANHADGTFEKWYTALGFKRQTVYNLIQRFEFLSSPKIGDSEDVFESLPLTLSYSVSRPDAPAELVSRVLDGDITTNAEYIKLKKELEEVRKGRDFAHNEYLEMADRNTALASENFHLEERIKELENRPVDVAVQPDTEALKEKDAEIKKLRGIQSEYEDEVNALESRIEELQERTPDDDVVSEFAEILMERTQTAIEDLCEFLSEHKLGGDKLDELAYLIGERRRSLR